MLDILSYSQFPESPWLLFPFLPLFPLALSFSLASGGYCALIPFYATIVPCIP
jgi:hypothetical protein